MKLANDIKKILRERPYWGARRISEHLGVTQKVVSVTATRHNIKFMSRQEVEAWVDQNLST